jgi:signal transduction histidine kinase
VTLVERVERLLDRPELRLTADQRLSHETTITDPGVPPGREVKGPTLMNSGWDRSKLPSMPTTLLENEAPVADTRRPAGAGARALAAADWERRRLERDLHDGAQQRLVALSLHLRLLGLRLEPGSETERLLLAAQGELAESLEELRELARGLHPAALTDHGLDVALGSLAARAPVPVRLAVCGSGPAPGPAEVAAYYIVSEALTNIAKYARASAAHVHVTRRDADLVVEVVDDGVGGADAGRGSGLRGLADRVEALGGQLVVLSPEGAGTVVRAEIPTR